MRKFLPKKGFTLVELVVVIAILGILIIALIATLNPFAQFSKAFDAQRKHDIMEIRNALDTYYNDKNCYPKQTSAEFPFGREWTEGNTVYMKLVPQDPQPVCLVGSGCYYYYYQTDTSLNSSDCPQWNILYTRLADKVPAGENCATIIHNACIDQGYRPSVNAKYNFCVISGRLDCSALMGLNNNPFVQLTPVPTSSPTPIPTSTPTPTPVLICNCPVSSYCYGLHHDSRPCTKFDFYGICNEAGPGYGDWCNASCSVAPTCHQ